jgi:hypothetical protein
MPAALAFLFSATGFLAMRKAVSRIVRACQGMKWGVLPIPQKLTRIELSLT